MTFVDGSAELWEGLGAAELERRWAVPAVHLFGSVGSTNDEGRRLAAAGAAPGTVVLADRQLAGRGRAGRPWDSPPGLGVWVSMIVAAPSDAAAAGILPLRAGVAAARALERFVAPTVLGVKWPNDLVIGGAKVGGVLCEGAWTGEVPGPVVVGVGLNVSQSEGDLPPEIRGRATSLALAVGRPVDRLAVADALVHALRDEMVEAALSPADLAEELAARDVLSGRRVVVTDPETARRRLEGFAAGISPDGALLVRGAGDGGNAAAVPIPVRAGTVRLADPLQTAEREPHA